MKEIIEKWNKITYLSISSVKTNRKILLMKQKTKKQILNYMYGKNNSLYWSVIFSLEP